MAQKNITFKENIMITISNTNDTTINDITNGNHWNGTSYNNHYHLRTIQIGSTWYLLVECSTLVFLFPLHLHFPLCTYLLLINIFLFQCITDFFI